MTLHAVIVAVLLVLAVGLVFLCSVGVLVMRDAYQKLHYIAPASTLSSALIALAVWIDEPQIQAGMKATFVALLLMISSVVVAHATARAARIRESGDWNPGEGEKVRVVGEDCEEPCEIGEQG